MAHHLLDKHEDRIRGMFNNIAPRYDLLNHTLSLNIDKRWRAKTVRLVPVTDGGPILDLCTGTGDLALAYDRAYEGRLEIVGADFAEQMLSRAKTKTEKRGASARIRFVEADAQQLPFADDYFEVVAVGFGLRNVTDPMRGLAEMVRVTKPGGRVAVLEFSKPRHWLFGPAYRWYFRAILPRLGQMVSRSKDSAYSYLPASVMEFPDGEALAAKMVEAGLRDVKLYPMTLGIATLYVGRK